MHSEDLAKINLHLEKNFPAYLEELRAWLRIGCSAAEEWGIQENVDHLFKLYSKLGGETEIIQLKDGNPVVYAKLLSKNPKAKTILHYNKYDLVPSNEPEWVVDPHSSTIMEAKNVPGLSPQLGKVLVARGTSDSKSPHFATIKGIQAMLEVTGDVPAHIHLIGEGEHEIGSPHLRQLNDIDLTKNVIKTADCWMQQSSNRGGSEKMGMDLNKAQVRLGCKGIVCCELWVKGGEWGGPVERALETEDTWIDAPAWRLFWALTSLKDSSGKILIDGFYDDMRPLTAEEKEYGLKLRDQVFDEDEWKNLLGIKQFRRGLSGKDLFFDWIFAPEINIIGVQGGYVGPGIKTSFPKEAWVKLSIRLQPNQDPQDIIWKLRKHLNTHGFPEVEIRHADGAPGVRTSVKTYMAKSLVNATKRIGLEPVIWPSLWGSSPYSVIIHPNVSYGGGNAISGGRNHQANEYVVVDTILDGMKFFATWSYEFAGVLPPLKK